jgi:hypothetical protein
MTTSIRARLQAAAAKYTTLCPLPLQDVEDAIDLIDELRDCLDELTAQIAAQAPTNPHRPDLRINGAFMKAMALLVRLDAEDGAASDTAGASPSPRVGTRARSRSDGGGRRK